MGFVADIFNLEIGLAVRNKLNVLMKFYNAVVKSDSLFNVERIDASFVKDATPTNTKFLRDDGTWQTVATNQDLEQTVTNGGIVNGSDNVTPIFQIDKVDDLVNVFSPSYFYENPVVLFEAVAKVMTLDVGNRLVSTGINTTDLLTQQVIQITSSLAPTVNTTGFRRTFVDITALAGNINLSTNLTGTPKNGDVLIFQIKDNGTARTITTGSNIEAKGESVPTTTVISKRVNIGFTWDSTTSKWGCLAVKQEA